MATIAPAMTGRMGGEATRAFLRGLAVALGLIALWQMGVWLSGVPAFLLPEPQQVFATLIGQWSNLWPHLVTTGIETVVGLALGVGAGVITALAMAWAMPVRRVLLPVLVLTQALPVFAIAPLLVLWFGFGLASKVVMAALIVYFPIASTFHDALARTDEGLMDLMRLARASRLQTLRLVRIPAALPALGSGLRVSATLAPIGAVVGEWVGAAAGLGFVMVQAQARVQTDVVFAALLLLMALALTLRWAADHVARRIAPWAIETTSPKGPFE